MLSPFSVRFFPMNAFPLPLFPAFIQGGTILEENTNNQLQPRPSRQAFSLPSFKVMRTATLATGYTSPQRFHGTIAAPYPCSPFTPFSFLIHPSPLLGSLLVFFPRTLIFFLLFPGKKDAPNFAPVSICPPLSGTFPHKVLFEK